jgi:hypothetical protein
MVTSIFFVPEPASECGELKGDLKGILLQFFKKESKSVV